MQLLDLCRAGVVDLRLALFQNNAKLETILYCLVQSVNSELGQSEIVQRIHNKGKALRCEIVMVHVNVGVFLHARFVLGHTISEQFQNCAWVLGSVIAGPVFWNIVVHCQGTVLQNGFQSMDAVAPAAFVVVIVQHNSDARFRKVMIESVSLVG